MWSGLGGVMTAVGPFAGGYLVSAASWRWIFLINLPFAAVALAVAARRVPESRDPDAPPRLDISGACLAAIGLGGIVFALIEGPGRGWTSPLIVASASVGMACLAVFAIVERRSTHPLVPLSMFASRQFTATNVVTFCVYGAVGGALFLLPIQLQNVVGFTPVAAGSALLPLTAIMLVGSPYVGRFATRIGARLPLTLGPLLAGSGLVLVARIDASSSYVSGVLPAIVVFGVGLALIVAPLTSTVLAAVPDEHAGVASAVNTSVARTGGLLAIAVLPVAAGLTDSTATGPDAFSSGFHTALLCAAGLMFAGAAVAVATLRQGRTDTRAHLSDVQCGLDVPVLRSATASSA